MEPRGPERSVSDLTADTLKNLERHQWQTHYSHQYTGLGPADPAQLTNLAEKQRQTIQEGAPDDDLVSVPPPLIRSCLLFILLRFFPSPFSTQKPRSTRTFDPPRPVEGRISRQIHPRPPMPPSQGPSPNRKPTLTEVEEDRLLNGKAYVSLPESAFDQMVSLFHFHSNLRLHVFRLLLVFSHSSE